MKKLLNRRHFLRGASGVSLAIPFLPSLIKGARAETLGGQKNFVALATGHGGVWGHSMYPDNALLTETLSYAGRDIRFGDLSGTIQNDNTFLCDVLQAPESLLTQRSFQKSMY